MEEAQAVPMNVREQINLILDLRERLKSYEQLAEDASNNVNDTDNLVGKLVMELTDGFTQYSKADFFVMNETQLVSVSYKGVIAHEFQDLRGIDNNTHTASLEAENSQLKAKLSEMQQAHAAYVAKQGTPTVDAVAVDEVTTKISETNKIYRHHVGRLNYYTDLHAGKVLNKRDYIGHVKQIVSECEYALKNLEVKHDDLS